MKKLQENLYAWVGAHVNAPYGVYIFSLLLFIEGFFIIPASTLLAFYCLENRVKAFRYAFIATIMSGLAALAGYGLGILLWQVTGMNILNYFITTEKFDYLVAQYKTYQAWAVFLVALTPMPFKALTITAGFCKLPVLPFILFTLMARGLRFFTIGAGIFFFGDRINYYLNKYFYFFVLLFISFFVILWWLLH